MDILSKKMSSSIFTLIDKFFLSMESWIYKRDHILQILVYFQYVLITAEGLPGKI